MSRVWWGLVGFLAAIAAAGLAGCGEGLERPAPRRSPPPARAHEPAQAAQGEDPERLEAPNDQGERHADEEPLEALPGARAEPRPQPEWTEAGAIVWARKYVRAGLKYPDDASFPWFGDQAAVDSSGKALVTGKVNAANELGAELTIPYECVLQHTHNDQWRLVAMSIDGELVHLDDAIRDRLAEQKRLASDPAYRRKVQQEAEQEERRASTREWAEHRKQQAEARRPEAARSLLENADKFLQHDKPDLAREWWQKVIDQYPETEAAEAAKRRLEGEE